MRQYRKVAMPNVESLRKQLIAHEGLRLEPYRCTSGRLTIGVGHNLDTDGLSWFFIGGRKPEDGITEDEAMVLLDHDLNRAMRLLYAHWPWVETELSDNRQAVLVDMLFNLGLKGLQGFKRTWAAIAEGDFQVASRQILASKYAAQVGKRARTLAKMMAEDLSFDEAIR